MKPPIFLSTPGTLDVFRSVEDAALYLEPEDIPVTLVFDCEGTRLTAIHAPPTDWLARELRFPGRTVVIEELAGAPQEPEQLRELIVNFLTALKHPAESLASSDLPRLVEMCTPYFSR